ASQTPLLGMKNEERLITGRSYQGGWFRTSGGSNSSCIPGAHVCLRRPALAHGGMQCGPCSWLATLPASGGVAGPRVGGRDGGSAPRLEGCIPAPAMAVLCSSAEGQSTMNLPNVTSQAGAGGRQAPEIPILNLARLKDPRGRLSA